MIQVAPLLITVAFLFQIGFLAQPAHAQTIIMLGAEEIINLDTFEQDGLGEGGDAGSQSMDVSISSGTFNQNYSQTVNTSLGSAHGYVSQVTTIDTNGNSLNVTGTFNSLNSSSATHDDMNDSGEGGTLPATSFALYFGLDQPFNYRLTVNISRSKTLTSDNFVDTYSGANLQFTYSDGTTNFVYGWSVPDEGGGFADDLYPKTATNNGVLPAGYYQLQVHMDNSAAFNGGPDNSAGDYSYDSSSALNFSLTVTPDISQPPVITSLTPDVSGAYQLNWTAPQAGNYRIESSPDLVNWSEAVASTSYSAGANVNLMSAIPDSPAGFYRVAYLP